MLSLVLLVLVALLALWPVLVRDEAPAAVDRAFFEPPWDEARPDGLDAPTLPDAVGQMRRYIPWYAYQSTVGASGDPHGILWNPLEGCGKPFLAVWRTRCLSPFTLPFYFLPLHRALQVSAILKLVLAGWCAFYACRKLGFAVPMAFAVSVAYELSGHVFLWLGWPMGDVVPWFPLLVVSTERLAVGQRKYWPLGALLIGVMALGGDPETLAGCVLAALVYLFLRGLSSSTSPTGALGGLFLLTITVTLGLALAGVQLVPYVEFLREASATGRDAQPNGLYVGDLVTCFLPNFFGPLTGSDGAQATGLPLRTVKLFHVGLVQLLLVALWLSVRSFVTLAQRRRVEAMLLTCLVMVLLALASSRLAALWPPLALLEPRHLLVANALFVAMMAAAAANEWLLLNVDQCKSAILRLFIFTPLLLAVGGACVYAQRGAMPPAASLWAQLAVAGVFAASVLALVVVTALRPSMRLFGYGLAALTFLSLIAANRGAIAYAQPGELFPETSFTQALKEAGGRVTGTRALSQWPLAANGIPQTFCADGVSLRRHTAFMERARQEPALLRRMGAPALLLGAEDIQGAFLSLRPAYEIEKVMPSGGVLFKDSETRPRAWIAYAARAVSKFDPAELSAGSPPLVEDTAAPDGRGDPDAKVVVHDSASPVRVSVDIDGALPGILVLADAYYPGWKAYVDGKAKKVFAVDGMFRGVQIDEGPHRVEFIYAPTSLRWGLYVTLGAACIILVEMRHLFLRLIRGRRSA
ncbi:MAG: YfhO family protein [Nitrospiraceae bacterium]|nr:YfhO family protein [Nitrospiraceae bacterium]